MKMFLNKENQAIFKCSKYIYCTISFLIVFATFSRKHEVSGREQYLRRYRPVQYYSQDFTPIRRLDSASSPVRRITQLKTVNSQTFLPRRRLIYSVTKPLRVRKVLTEVDGKLVYKVPHQISSPFPSSLKHVSSYLPPRNYESNADKQFDMPENPTLNHPNERVLKTIYNSKLTRRPTSALKPATSIEFPQKKNSRFVPSYNSRTTAYDIDNNRFYIRNRNPAYQVPVKTTSFHDNDRSLLSNIVPPPGLKLVVANGGRSSVDLRNPTRYTGGKSVGYSQKRNYQVPNKLEPTTSSRKVLRIQAASMDEARAIIAKIGPGFKVRVINGTALIPTSVTALQISDFATANSLASEEPATSTQIQIPFLITTTATTTTITAATTTENSNLWWKGANVCMKATPGVYGISKDLWPKIQIVKTCREKRHKYICIEKYGFGPNSPTKTVSYRCCQGYTINADRQRCKPRSIRQKISRPRVGKKLINRKEKASSVKAKSSITDVETLTIFMPGDDVVREAFPSGGGSRANENYLVQKFLENHVIPNKMLLSSHLRNNQVLTAVSGNPIRVNFYRFGNENIMTANCRKVLTRNVTQENSVIHFTEGIIEDIDGTIYDYLNSRRDQFSSLLSALDAAGISSQLQNSNNSFTLFAPTDEVFEQVQSLQRPGSCLSALALNHVVEDVVCTAGTEIKKRTVTTLQGERMHMHANLNMKFIGDAQITSNDIMTSNGVIHIIDGVLKPSAAATVLDVLKSNSRYSSALKIFQAADITEGLVTGNNFTVIVPINKAFKRISRTALMNLRKNTETLSSTVMFHLIPAEINVDKLQSDQAIETLYPPHNLHASVYAMKMKISSSNARKRYIKKSATSLQCARIIDQADQKPCNGKILVVDELFKPPSGTILSALMNSKRSNFSTLLTAVKRTGLEQMLDDGELLTMYAPSEVAFSRFPSRVTQRLLSNIRLLTRVLKFHLVPGYRCKHELMQRPHRHRTMLRSTVFTCPKRKRVYLGRRRQRLRAKILESNIQATNGIIHEIDNLLLPKRFRLF